MNNQNISEEERHEAATEEAATVGCPSLGLPKLPGGFDGTEPAGAQGGGAVPAPHMSEEKKKLEDSYLSMRGRLEKIADLALAADAKCGVSGRIGENWMTCSKAIAEIRRICKESLVEEVLPDYEWLAKIMTDEHFEPERLAKAIEAEASKRPIEYPTGWLCELAKRLQGREKPLDPTAPEMQLPKLVKRCAKTPQTIVFEIVRPSGMKLSAEWEAEETGHSAQGFLYRDDKCVCQIRFFKEFQTRNVGSKVTSGALQGIVSLVGRPQRRKINKAAKQGGEGVPPSQKEGK